ncbi:MAG: YwbE family protein [Desulfobacteraceae bacterium]
MSRRRATKTEGFVYPSKAAIKPGSHVKVVQKQDQRTGKLTEGVVKNILTNFATHPHGIKVRLENGVVGRVKEVIDQS